MTDRDKLINRIIAAIEADLLDRSGLQQALEDCDAAVRKAIRAAWRKAIRAILCSRLAKLEALAAAVLRDSDSMTATVMEALAELDKEPQ